MEYIQLKFIESVKKPKNLELDFILEDYSKKDALNLWYDTGEDNIKSKIPKGYKKKKIENIAVIVGGRLYVDETKGYVRGNTAYIDIEKYFNLF